MHKRYHPSYNETGAKYTCDRATEESQTMGAADPTKLLKPETTKLLELENWPTPKWYAEGKARRIQTYEEYFTFQLRARYSELENDFRSVLGNFPNIADVVTATRISDILQAARSNLERERDVRTFDAFELIGSRRAIHGWGVSVSSKQSQTRRNNAEARCRTRRATRSAEQKAH